MSGERRRRTVVAGEGYVWSGVMAFTAACVLYALVQGIYALAVVAGVYGGLVIAGGTGILLGLVMEWLRRRRL